MHYCTKEAPSFWTSRLDFVSRGVGEGNESYHLICICREREKERRERERERERVRGGGGTSVACLSVCLSAAMAAEFG
jgi:hypothetical protein